MKINNKILSLPPYISSAWSNILSLHMKNNLLIVTTAFGETITIPSLDDEIIATIFSSHADYLESEPLKGGVELEAHQQGHELFPSLLNGMVLKGDGSEATVRLGMASFDGLTSIMQHEPTLADAPDLPTEIIDKISAIARIVSPEEASLLASAEPHCNCPYCQIARAVSDEQEEAVSEKAIGASEEAIDEEVSEEELRFQQWDIAQASENLYRVSNRLDPLEVYSVYLGIPVGCTCGKSGCEHIVAVLKS